MRRILAHKLINCRCNCNGFYFLFQIIKAARKLELQVRNVGRVPGSFETHQGYTWVDPVGRSVSPPPEIDRVGRYDTRGERKSGLMLLKDSDERKVCTHYLYILSFRFGCFNDCEIYGDKM